MKILTRFRLVMLVITLGGGIWIQQFFGQNIFFIKDVTDEEFLTKLFIFPGKILPFLLLVGVASDNPTPVFTRYSSKHAYWIHKLAKVLLLAVVESVFFSRAGDSSFSLIFLFILMASVQQLTELYFSAEISLIFVAVLIASGLFIDLGQANFLLLNLYHQNLAVIVITTVFVLIGTELLMERKEIL